MLMWQLRSAGEADAWQAPVEPFWVRVPRVLTGGQRIGSVDNMISVPSSGPASKGSMHPTLPRLPAGVGQMRAAGAGWLVQPLCRAQWRQRHDKPTGAMLARQFCARL